MESIVLCVAMGLDMTERERLQAVFDVLDDQLGDTDPHTDIPWDEWDDGDLKEEHPLMWCCRQLSEVIGKPRTDEEEKAFREEQFRIHRKNCGEAREANGGSPIRLGIDEC